MIIGFDPSTKGTGWAVLNESGELIDYGALRPPKSCKTVQEKLLYLYNEIYLKIEKWKPNEAISEDQFGGNNIKTLKTLSQLRGVIMLACEQHSIEMQYYWPTTVKLANTGSGKGKKADMIRAICQRYGLEGIDDDTADAIGVAYTHYIKRGEG